MRKHVTAKYVRTVKKGYELYCETDVTFLFTVIVMSSLLFLKN